MAQIAAFFSPGSPYEGGWFKVKLVVGSEFPASPPKGYFLTNIFHPNVSTTGKVCVNALKNDWECDFSVKHILMVVFNLFIPLGMLTRYCRSSDVCF